MVQNCEIPAALYRAQPIDNKLGVQHGLTLHHIMIVVAAVCTLVTVVFSFFLFARHLTRFEYPEQQKHLTRIAILPGIFALFHLFGVIFYNASKYLEVLPTLFEAIAICSVFELCVAYVSSGVRDDAAARFRHTARTGRYAAKNSGPLLLRINFVFLYQLPFVILACVIATEVTSAVQCELSSTYRSSQKVIRLIGAASTIVALAQIITFHIVMRHELRGSKLRRKIIGIKILAAFVIAVMVVFGFLKPGMTQSYPHASYFDIVVGVPNLLTCIAMVLFALAWFFLFGFSSVVRHDASVGRLPALKALLQVINISDIYSNTLAALTTKVEEEKKTSLSSDTTLNGFQTQESKAL